ncbi:MAG TPA: hypothetical protein VJS44_18960 [Pyrinomonadaceae bacterium]|nr:hypothetical protein [Pyrinomonadaceae bacterium]
MKGRKKNILLLSAVFIALVLAMLGVQANQKQSGLSSSTQKKIKDIKAPATGKQRTHSKLLRQSTGPKISDLTAKGAGDIVLTVDEPFVISTTSSGQQSLPSIETQVCNADAVVVGTLTDSSPQLTEDESFLFTEYTMSAEEVIKNNSKSPIQLDSISVVRDGGIGQFNGRTIVAKIEGFAPFIEGKRYLLFLRFIPDTGSYLAYANGSFELKKTSVIPLGSMSANISKEASSFLSLTRQAAALNNCSSSNPGQK